MQKLVSVCLCLSIANWVLYKRDLEGDNYCLKFIVKFRKKNCIFFFFYFLLCNFLVRTQWCFRKKIQNLFAHNNMPSKVAHNPTSFWYSKFLLCETETGLYSENFSALKLSNFAGWRNSLEFLWCRYNSIPLHSTQLSILRFNLIVTSNLKTSYVLLACRCPTV